MRYLEIDSGSPDDEIPRPTWWMRVLMWLIPAANPDLEPYLYRTQIWWLEIDDDGLPQREIGFDVNGQAIVLGPVEGNHGYLIDASDDWSDSNKDSPEAARHFDTVWNSLWPKFEDLDRRNRQKRERATSSQR